jgi:glutathione S-transferase
MRLHAIPFSTNVDRVALALGLKGVAHERVEHHRADRSALRTLSGQDLVPVLELDDGRVLTESMDIVAWIDRTWPSPALYPSATAARREVEGFVGFFDRVWKVPPNAIEAERQRSAPDERRIAAWGTQLRGWRHGFEALLTGRDFLFGETPGAADLCAHPFLRFAAGPEPGDDDPFHAILVEHLALDGAFGGLAAWIARMDTVSQAAGIRGPRRPNVVEALETVQEPR